MEIFERLPDARDALQVVIDYAASRQTRIVGLGALLPSITRQGRILDTRKSDTGVKPVKGFTALAIASSWRSFTKQQELMVHRGYRSCNGSTGRATVRCLLKAQPWRS